MTAVRRRSVRYPRHARACGDPELNLSHLEPKVNDVAFKLTGVELAEWQQRAVRAWAAGDGTAMFRGTLEIFTGGGKTLIALACAEVAARRDPSLRLAVVVPTEALARQWRDVLIHRTSLSGADIGLLGARSRDN